MTQPNGQQQGEPVDYGDVIKYWQDVVMDLHSRLSIAGAIVQNREREISELRAEIDRLKTSSPKPTGG